MFDREIEESVEIAANPAEVWYHLTNFQVYPEWNPLIRSVSGELREGARLTLSLRVGSMPAVIFRPCLLVVDRERELRWLGGIGGPLFEGEHAFVIDTLGLDSVRFTQSERFGGVLSPGAVTLMEDDLRAAFREMNEALRQRSEASHASHQVAEAQRREKMP